MNSVLLLHLFFSLLSGLVTQIIRRMFDFVVEQAQCCAAQSHHLIHNEIRQSIILMPVNLIVLNNSQYCPDTCSDVSSILNTCQQRQSIKFLLLGGLIHFWQEAEKIALKAASCMFHILPQNQRNDLGVLSTNRASEPRRDASKKFPLARGLGGSYTYWTFPSRSFCTGLTRSWITVSGKSWL